MGEITPFDINRYVREIEDRLPEPKKSVRPVVHIEPMLPFHDTRTQELIHSRPVNEKDNHA